MTPPLEMLDQGAGIDRGDCRRLGEILLSQSLIDQSRLDLALARQRTSQQRLGEVLLSRGLLDGHAIASALAAQWGVAQADLEREPPDGGLIEPDLVELYLRHRILPWRRAGSLVSFVTDRPEAALTALASIDAVGSAVAVVPTRQFDQAIGQALGPALARRAAERTPLGESVRALRRARLISVAVLLGLITMLFWGGLPGIALACGALLVLNLSTTILRLAALIAGRPPARHQALSEAVGALPVTTILVPLFREARMVAEVVSALAELDYPAESLDVKLLLEEGDADTRAAVAQIRLPGWVQALVVPAGMSQTKPRALNYALDFARGEIIGILDAEDRPDPGQLRQVAGYLGDAPADVACVQCQLSFYNATENWITRCFQIEYAIWFEVLLGGFQRLSLPIPLGGTSVYFRRSALERLGAWDAHNVTEDADLGMRLARRGMRWAVLKCTTGEEANCQLAPWIRQRSRWLKGYLLTWLSHMRAPARLWRELGLRGFLGLNILFLGAAATYLAMPVFWIAVVTGVLTGQTLWQSAMPGWAFWPLIVSLALGQVVMLGCAALAMIRRRSLRLLIWVPTLPVYWTLGAIAAWKAVIEIVLLPYYWDKTQHGISRVFKQRARAGMR